MHEPTPPRQALALSRSADDEGARLVAKGYGGLAERIIAEARNHGVYVHDAPELVALLMRLDLDEQVPASLYDVVAELLTWVSELDAKAGESEA
ncbi:MAG TPA: EscU/YscU/HrcU family type III secretion system export apparatus switch protein [Oleiagrimonas sp.]|nr:EscU/YscU/HrcU family type III secretion system export apparatus switch protein [Oleiagrimonas sp.]